MSEQAKHRTRDELLAALEDIWTDYPGRLSALPEEEQLRFAQQQGYGRPQDLLAHLGAWMEEVLRVMPYLLRDERPPRDYADDAEFNARAVEHFARQSCQDVEAWYEDQRRTLKSLVAQLPPDALDNRRVQRWLAATIIEHYDEHPLPK